MKNEQELIKKELTPEELAKQMALEELATKNCLVRVVAGSHAYGTNIPSSDWDERSIFVDEMPRIILPFEKIEQVTYLEDDKVSFELSKYIPLLLAQNPNVIELLWTDEQDVLYKNELGQLLIDNRAQFLTLNIKDSYVGYAMAQLKRIKGHNKWINSPQPEREPQQGDYTSVVWNFSNNPEFNKHAPQSGYIGISLGNHHYSLWNAERLGLSSNKSWIDKRGNPNILEKTEFDKINVNNLPPDLIAKINFTLFEAQHKNWKGYWEWKNKRNEKRSALEEQFGYDTKHAMHLIRLLRSGVDILKHGVVPVKREDAQYLLDIRFGKYTYEEVIAESERLTKEVEEISKKSHLRKEPDFDFAKALMLEIYSKQWGLSTEYLLKNKLNR